jgi:predicted RNase H-like HicB family nuclease
MKFDVIITQDEDGYFVASVPSLPGCHTQARSLEELALQIKEAIALRLEARGTKSRAGLDAHQEIIRGAKDRIIHIP